MATVPVPAVPVAAGALVFDPSARMAIGCRSSKTGICGVELSKSARSVCRYCQTKITGTEARFLYWHGVNKPAGYIHTRCIVGLPLPAAELRENLAGLSPTEPSLRQAIVDAMAALAARAF